MNWREGEQEKMNCARGCGKEINTLCNGEGEKEEINCTRGAGKQQKNNCTRRKGEANKK